MEKWLDIPGYEGKYQVSNLGHVKSLARKVGNDSWNFWNTTERILKLGRYVHVDLCKDGSIKRTYVPKLVLDLFGIVCRLKPFRPRKYNMRDFAYEGPIMNTRSREDEKEIKRRVEIYRRRIELGWAEEERPLIDPPIWGRSK